MVQNNKLNGENKRVKIRRRDIYYRADGTRRRRINLSTEQLIERVERSGINRGLQIRLINDINDGIITDDIALYEKMDEWLQKQKNRVVLLNQISSYSTEVDEEDPEFIDEVHNYLNDYLRKEILNYHITDLDSLIHIEKRFFKFFNQICDQYDEEGIWHDSEEIFVLTIQELKERN